MHYKEYATYDATALAKLVRQKEVSPQELLETAIARAEKINPIVNAVVQKHYDLARAALKSGLPDGPLHGVPFLLKDISGSMAGTISSMGSKLFSDFVQTTDSTLVSRYKAAGLNIFGKTNTPEMGLAASTETALFGTTRNPWNLARTSGGSSGGTAAAVASGIVPVAHGSDGGGSIRIPASCCGLFGLKPTRARIPLGPLVGEGWGSMGTAHVLTRSVRDSALFLDISHGPAAGDPYFAPHFSGSYVEEVSNHPGALKIAVQKTPLSGVAVDPDCLEALDKSIHLLEKLGHQIHEVDPPGDPAELGIASWTLVAANVYATLQKRVNDLGRELTDKDVEAVTWNAIKFATSLTPEAYPNALKVIHQLGRKMAQFHERFDILLSPTLAKPAVELGPQSMSNPDQDAYRKAILEFSPFTNIENMSGQPSMSVPLYWSKDNMPIGMMFSAAFGREDLLLRLAGQLEAELPWFSNTSEIFGEE